MVLQYYGNDANEKALYRAGKLPGHTGCWDVAVAPMLIKKGYTVTGYWNGSIKAWKLGTKTNQSFKKAKQYATSIGFTHKRNATIPLIKRIIAKGVPVLAEVDADQFYGGNFGWTHVILIAGFDHRHFIIHDPAPHFGARNRKVAISHFKHAWERLFGLAGRSLIVIEKAQH